MKALVVIIAALAVGCSAAPAPTAPPAPSPQVVYVNRDVPGPTVTNTVTLPAPPPVTTYIEVTPKVCTEALDLWQASFNALLGYAPDGTTEIKAWTDNQWKANATKRWKLYDDCIALMEPGT